MPSPLSSCVLFGTASDNGRGAPYKLVGRQAGGDYQLAVEACDGARAYAGSFGLDEVVEYLQEEQYVGVPKSSVVESTPKMASLLEQAFDWGGYQKVPVALFEAGGLVLLGDCQTDSGNHVKIRLPPKGTLAPIPSQKETMWVVTDMMSGQQLRALRALRSAEERRRLEQEGQLVSARDEAEDAIAFVVGMPHEDKALEQPLSTVACTTRPACEPSQQQQQQAPAGGAASQLSPQMSQQQSQQQSQQSRPAGRGEARGRKRHRGGIHGTRPRGGPLIEGLPE